MVKFIVSIRTHTETDVNLFLTIKKVLILNTRIWPQRNFLPKFRDLYGDAMLGTNTAAKNQ